MIALDSSVRIDFLNGVESSMDAIPDAGPGKVPMLVGDLVLTEVLQAF
jgi:hypothetical protein